MTWEDWCNSEYYEYGYYRYEVYNDRIIDSIGGSGNRKFYVCLEESETSCVKVLKNDLIIDGASYGARI